MLMENNLLKIIGAGRIENSLRASGRPGKRLEFVQDARVDFRCRFTLQRAVRIGCGGMDSGGDHQRGASWKIGKRIKLRTAAKPESGSAEEERRHIAPEAGRQFH